MDSITCGLAWALGFRCVMFVLQREEEEAAEVYKEFVESFEDSEKGLNRSWVKGGVVNPEKGNTELISLTFIIACNFCGISFLLHIMNKYDCQSFELMHY